MGRRAIDRTGQIVNGMEFLEKVGKDKGGNVIWKLKCHCGSLFECRGYTITKKSGWVKSCGCLDDKKKNGRMYTGTHGDSRTRLYSIWRTMKHRCSPNGHKDYYGKGISVCSDWQEYIVFRDWAQKNGYKENLTIDRIDVNGNYTPENCRWVDMREQGRNRGVREGSHSSVAGVRIYKETRWSVDIGLNNKTIFLGYFSNLKEAIEARRQAEIEYWGKEYQDFATILNNLEGSEYNGG